MRNSLSEAWADDLSIRVSMPVYAQRRDAAAVPPFAVVRIEELDQIIGGTDVWHGEIKVVVVTDIYREGGGAVVSHHDAVKAIYDAIEATPIGCVDEERNVRLYGFDLHRHEEVQVSGPRGEKVYADVFFITAGAGRA